MESSEPSHPEAVRRVHQRLLDDAGLTRSTIRTADGAAVNVMTAGEGPTVVLIHGSGSPGLFWSPLLSGLQRMRVVVVDRPGFGLSDPGPGAATLRENAVQWVGRLLDALGLASTTLVGHSMGGLWSLHFALAHPERVTGLAVLGAPALPGTSAPLPFRLMATPGVGTLMARQRETQGSVLRFASFMGEGDTLPAHPGLVDLLVASGNDRVARRALHAEVRALLSSWAILAPSSFRRSARVTEADLLELSVPTLLLSGDRDPVGDREVATRLLQLIPRAKLHLVSAGHAPWLGRDAEVADALGRWVDGLAR